MSVPQREDILDRFARKRPSDVQLGTMNANSDAIRGVAARIIDTSYSSREQSLTLTALQEAKFWANENIVANGVREADAAGAPSALATSIEQDDNVPAATVGQYLATLLITLLREEEGFDGKRPLGNSGWLGYIEDALGTSDLDQLEDEIRAALS